VGDPGGKGKSGRADDRYAISRTGRLTAHPSGVSGAGLSGGSEQDGQDVALDCQGGVVGRLCLRVPQDGVGVGIDDNRGARAMAGESNAQSPGVGRKRGRFTVASVRMDDHDRFALEALGLVGGADQHAGQIGQTSGYGAGLLERLRRWPARHAE
jgi:hypothetical protein